MPIALPMKLALHVGQFLSLGLQEEQTRCSWLHMKMGLEAASRHTGHYSSPSSEEIFMSMKTSREILWGLVAS